MSCLLLRKCDKTEGLWSYADKLLMKQNDEGYKTATSLDQVSFLFSLITQEY